MRFILEWEPIGHGHGAWGEGRSREREESKETSRSIPEKPGAACSLVSGVRALSVEMVAGEPRALSGGCTAPSGLPALASPSRSLWPLEDRRLFQAWVSASRRLAL